MLIDKSINKHVFNIIWKKIERGTRTLAIKCIFKIKKKLIKIIKIQK